jgi:hypothetical protein
MKIRNRADAILANRLTARIPTAVEVYYFLQNHQWESEDSAAILDRIGPGSLESCHRVFHINDVDNFEEV